MTTLKALLGSEKRNFDLVNETDMQSLKQYFKNNGIFHFHCIHISGTFCSQMKLSYKFTPLGSGIQMTC